MENLSIGGYKDIDSFVEAKLKKLDKEKCSFSTLFELMFSESENLMYEKSEGYRIKKTTYGEAKKDILHLASSLKSQLELPFGSVIGLSMDNSLLWIEMFWSIIVCGWRPLLMNLRLDDNTLEKALRDCDAKAVISDKRIYSINTVNADDIKQADTPYTSNQFGEELLVMSSGTTEHLKICAFSAEEFRYQIHDSYQIIKECEIVKRHYDGHLKQLTFLPFYHVFGLIAMYIWFAFFSRSFVQLNDMSSQTVLNTIKRHKVTHIFAVPLFWETVYDQAVRTIKNRGEKTYRKFLKGMRISRKLSGMPALSRMFSKKAFKEVRENLFGESICFLITGGSSIRKEVVEFFNAIGYRLADGYGMTEIGITSVELSDDVRILNSCYIGRPMSHAEYMINEKGELLVRGNILAKYIIEDGRKTVTDKTQWFNTHDLAECKNGHYRILGRTDDLIVSSTGENLNPNLTEPLLKVAGANGVCIISNNKTPVLIVSVNQYIDRDQLKELDRNIKDRINELNLSGQIGKIVYIRDRLLNGDEFKLNRKRIADDYKSGKFKTVTFDSLSSERNDDALTLHLREIFAAALETDISNIAPDSDFFTDLGGSSLDYLAVTAKLQEDFSIPFPQGGDSCMATVSQLHDYIKENTAQL